LISIFVFTSIVISQNVSQLGLSIGGTSAGDLSGNSVSMNTAGDRIAIGSPGGDGSGDNAGHVRIYSYVNSSWVQLGADIKGEAAGDQSGFSVSLNSVGDRIAIGAPGNDGNGAGAGHTRVYQYANGSWNKLGIDLDALKGEQSGYSVSMNATGDRVAVGAPLSTCNPNELFGCYPFGAVRVWQYNTSTGGWTILGDIIVNDSGQKGGYSVSLNAAGDRVAMGIPDGGRYGIARVYGFSNNKWGKLGGDMASAVYGDFGWSVALDSAGTRVVIGEPNGMTSGIGYSGKVSVFEFDNNIWSKLGETIHGKGGGETLGESVSINAKGNRIILGGSFRKLDAFLNPTVVSPGVVRVYDLNNGNWTETINKIVGDTLGDKFGNSVSVNADGDRFVVGAFNNNKNGENAGIVKSYEFDLQMKIAAANKDNISIPNGSTTNDSLIILTFSSSKSTSDFVVEDIIASGGSLSAFNAVSGQVFTSVFTPSQEGTSTIIVAPGAFTDTFGRSNADTSNFTWTYDITGPNMLISAENSSGTIINNNSTTGDDGLLLTFTSSEETSTFTVDDILVSGGTLEDFKVISEKVYTSNLTPTISGTITIDVAAGTFTDSIGNENLAAPQFNWTKNYAPSMSNIDDVKFEEDSSLTLALTATDADDDAITFSALSDTSAVSTLITSSNLTLTPSPNWNGKAIITVYASDGISKDSVAFNLEVIPINDPPQAFDWVSTPLDTINITQSNLSDTYTLQWSESIDVDGAMTIISQDTVMAFHSVHIAGGYRDNFFGISDSVYQLNESLFKKDEKITIKSQSTGVTGHFQIDNVTGVMENSGIRYLYIQTSTWSGCDTCPKSISDELGDNTRLGDTWTLYNYFNYQVFAQVGMNPKEKIGDTTSTSVPITYQELLENVFEPFPMLPKVTVRFSVNATDGIDTVKVTGDDRVVFVNRYDYL